MEKNPAQREHDQAGRKILEAVLKESANEYGLDAEKKKKPGLRETLGPEEEGGRILNMFRKQENPGINRVETRKGEKGKFEDAL